MDFNINNETFANAYKCLNDANIMLDSGLGNFNELNESALTLIGKSGWSNDDRLNNSNKHCSELKDKMYNTIKSLSEFNIESAEYFSTILNNSFSIDFNIPENELSYDDAVALAEKLQVPVEYIISLHLHEGYEIGDRLIPKGITPDVIHYAGENGFPVLIDGIKKNGDSYKADAPERNTYFNKNAENFSVVNGGSEYNIQGWPITFGETEGKDIYWTYYGPISQGKVLNQDAAPIQCTDTDLFPCDDGHYRDKDGYIVIAGTPYVNQFYDGVHVDYEANGGLDYEDTFVVTPFGLGRFYDHTAIKVQGGIESDFYINDGYESNNIAQTKYGKRLRESAVERYESLNLYWNDMIH